MAQTAYAARPGVWASFGYRDFRFLWGGGVFHALSWGMEMVALGWLVLELTDEPFLVGVAFAAGMAPFFFLGIVSGSVADRVNRRVFLRFVYLGGSGVAGIMAILMFMDVLQIWPIILLAGVAGCLKAFFGTVSQAYAYDIVGPERSLNGLALMSSSHRFGALIGSLGSGFVIREVGIEGQYVLIGATYIVGMVVLMGTREVGQAAVRHPRPVFENLVGWVRLIRQNRVLLALMYLAAVTEIFGFTHQSAMPVFAREVLGVGSVGLGVMSATVQVGGLAGLFSLARLRNSGKKGLYAFLSAGGFGLGLMAFSLYENFIFYLFVIAVVNACATAADTLYKTLMQENVPNEQRGRAMGSWVLAIGTAPSGHLEVGWVAGMLGAPRAMLINGGILAIANLLSGAVMPRIRRLP